MLTEVIDGAWSAVFVAQANGLFAAFIIGVLGRFVSALRWDIPNAKRRDLIRGFICGAISTIIVSPIAVAISLFLPESRSSIEIWTTLSVVALCLLFFTSKRNRYAIESK